MIETKRSRSSGDDWVLDWATSELAEASKLATRTAKAANLIRKVLDDNADVRNGSDADAATGIVFKAIGKQLSYTPVDGHASPMQQRIGAR